MDVEQEKMQFLGIFGIFLESIKLIYTWRRIFTQITLALILPLCFLTLAYMEIFSLFVQKITHDALDLEHTQRTTPKFLKLSNIVVSEIIYFSLCSIAYFIFSIIFSVLATSAVDYAVACIYTAGEVTFKQVVGVLPKVWKRTFVTFLCVSAALLAVNFVALSAFSLFLLAITLKSDKQYDFSQSSMMIFTFAAIVYTVAIWYLTIIWQLSSVVSVLEGSCGFKAMAKSKALVKGKMAMVGGMLVWLSLPSVIINFVFRNLVDQRWSESWGVVALLGIVGVLLLSLFVLFRHVTETVLYFVCKSHHQEYIDKSAIADHLPVYQQGDGYVQLRTEDIHVEKFQEV